MRAGEILSLGEPMVEFNQTGERGGRLYLQGYGGDTSNFAIAAARQGARVGYLSALGDDPYGRLLRALWDAEGVDHAGVSTDATAFTARFRTLPEFADRLRARRTAWEKAAGDFPIHLHEDGTRRA